MPRLTATARAPLVCALVLSAGVTAGAAGGPRQESDTGVTHSFLVTGGRTYIVQADGGAGVDGDSRVAWEWPGGTREGWVLPGGNVLLAVSKGKDFPGGGAVEVTRDGEKKVVWQYKGTQDEVNSVQKTGDGTYVVSEAGKNPRILEIDASGKVVAEVKLACQTANSHMETRMARKLADGTYLAPHLLDFAIKQYDKDGKVLKVIDTTVDGDKKVHSWPFTAIRLLNGNTLAGLTHANRVTEFDPDGKRVWEVTNDDVGGVIKDACGVQRLPNGNTVIASYAAGKDEVRLLEVTPEKKVVWTYRAPPEFPGVHHFHVFETNGKAVEGPPLR